MAAGALMLTATAFAQDADMQKWGQAIVTVLPSHESNDPAAVNLADLKLRVDGKPSTVTAWTPLRGANNRLELVLMIDGSARSSLAGQLSDIASFIKETPSGAKIALAYMSSGRAMLAGPLSSDPAQILRGLHMPLGSAGSNGSPYFCLSDLARHWPSNDRGARREVMMITDGVDPYNPGFDPDNSYVQSAIADSARAGLVVYSIFWHNQGYRYNQEAESDTGQNLLSVVSTATGGISYWHGTGNPISFQPYFEDLRRRLRNQYELRFSAPIKGKPTVVDMKLKVSAPAINVDAPHMVFMGNAAVAVQ
jgi:hypothetical protein